MYGRAPSYPCKNQEMSVTYRGRTYGICSQEQLDYLIMMQQQTLMVEAAHQGKTLSEAELKAKLDEYAENCGNITLDKLLAKMSPEEQRAWQDSYRFTPITRRL